MLKNFIIICLIALSFQIEHCVDYKKICKSCVTNFELVELNFDYDVNCFNSQRLKEINNIIENCVSIEADKQTCKECRRNYFWDTNQKKCILYLIAIIFIIIYVTNVKVHML